MEKYAACIYGIGVAWIMTPGEKALEAIKQFLEWGAKTSSDRELFDDKFRKILQESGIEFNEPEY